VRVAVTGASGFVGGAVCRAMIKGGHQVHGYGRRDAHPIPGYRGWDIAAGPLPDPPEVDVVVHCAGTVTDWDSDRRYTEVNVDGTGHVLATFPAARFVHVSTASVYDPFRPTVMATEDEAPVSRYVNGYGRSKAAAERLVLAAARERPSIILRPHAVYGPGDTTLLPRVLAGIRGGRLLAVGDGRQRISLTSVGNLVGAILLAATGPVGDGVFNVTDAAPVRLDDALRAILAERGLRARPAYLPVRPALALAAVAEWCAGPGRPPRLTRYAAGHLAVERTLDITAARERLGYDPAPTSFAGAATW
jgi:2-alkyl-3-oxoalkanoate reductase